MPFCMSVRLSVYLSACLSACLYVTCRSTISYHGPLQPLMTHVLAYPFLLETNVNRSIDANLCADLFELSFLSVEQPPGQTPPDKIPLTKPPDFG